MKPIVIVAAIAALLGLAAPTPPAPGGPEGCNRDDPAFVGVKECKTCHFAQWQSWKKTDLAKAFDTLKPGNKAEEKKKFNLDPQKDYTTDATCLPCHTTGYGKPGGYPEVGKDWSDADKKKASELEGVQCEACHGPGSLTGPYKKEHEDYKLDEVLKLGLVKPDAKNCETCHNPKSPTVAKDYKVDFEALTKDRDKIHKSVPLKHKH